MRVKDLERTANVAWSPAKHHPIMMAAGTAAQQLDASFNTSAALEIFSLSLSEPGADMEKVAGVPTEHRFHQVVWGPGGTNESGMIIGGCDGGLIQVYNPSYMLTGKEALVARKDGHTGPVKALDLNPFQSNLLASGASDSEIFIWDLDQLGSPMTPGAKAQPPDVVGWLSWNRQVQHILASTFSSRCVVWDLRKNEPIIKLVDTTSHVRWKVVNWHPDVATQLCLASEDDMSPVVQLWDLRFATSPLKVLANHTRGVTCIAWCMHDPDLLLSCGRDNRILCWNPNETNTGAELLCEIQSPNQWLFDVAWCPRNPALISSSSFDGHISVYSLTGGQQQIVPTTSKIAESFPGMDAFAPAVAPQPHVHASVDLRKPPKWLRRPAGVSFAFGGRLVNYGTDQPGRVFINQMVSEPELLEKASKLDASLATGQQAAFCAEQAATASSPHLRTLWRFLSAEFSQDPRSEILNLLGYPTDQLSAKLNNVLGKNDFVNQLTNDVSHLSTGDEPKTEDSPEHKSISDGYQEYPYNGIDSSHTEKIKEKQVPFTIPTSDDAEGLIGQALLLGQTEAAVELCFKQGRMADALLLAMTGGSELLARTQYRYFEQSKGWLSKIISAVVSEDWDSVVGNCSASSWRQALAATLTHTKGDEFYRLCEKLGERLESEDVTGLSENAQLCYLCSGNIEKLVTSWTHSGAPSDPLKLQELVQVTVMLQASATLHGRPSQSSLALAELLTNYAFLLASQGSFSSALAYLDSAHEEAAMELKDRLQQALGMGTGARQYQQQGIMNPRASFASQGRRSSGHLISHPSFPQMADHVYDSKSRSRTVSQSSYEAQAYSNVVPPPSAFNAFPVSGSPQPTANQFMQPAYNAPITSPPTSGKPSGLHAATGRKYVADPSVQSPNAYQSYTGSSSYGASPGMYGGAQPSSFMPTSQPAGPAPTMYNPSAVMENPSPSAFTSFRPQETPSIPTGPKPPTRLMESQQAPPGWNDPPSLSSSKSQPKTDYVPQNPITHPLFGAAPQEQATPSSTMGQLNGGVYGGVQQYNQPQQYPVSFSPQPTQYLQPAAPIQAPVAPAMVAEPPKPKAAIPEASAHLPRIFDELRDRCSHAAGNPLTRRKLDDVARKLETLYDSLREYKLSASTLECLNQMTQFIQVGDYASGLQLHTQMISGPDFSQISAFMPGLKVLLQTAMQLGVYLQ